MKCNHPIWSPVCSFHYNGECIRDHNYECPALAKPRYIDADTLKQKKVYSHERHEYVVPVAEIDWASTADVVEVVRCKDCKYYELIYSEGDNERLCNNGLGLQLINDDSYCPYGKRKEKTDETN